MRAAVASVDLPYVKPERDRQGRIKYWYFRRHGARTRLPGEPLSDEFMAAYHRLKAATDVKMQDAPSRPAYTPGTFGWLVLHDYFVSPEFTRLAPSSQEMYRRILDPLAERHGTKRVAKLERRHIKSWRDERAEKPGMANMVVKVVRLLMSYAVDNDYRADNPALRIQTFKLGEHRAWTVDELVAYERRWRPGTMQRRAYALARYTGQRCGDVADMTRAHRRAGEIRVKQEKTNAELWIPEHRDLAAELARGEQGHLSLLVKERGSAFTARDLSTYFASWIEAAGLPDDCVMHGLRKVAARDLADAGCSAHEIQAITGHKSLKEIERYTRAADQRRLASAAIHRLENADRTRTGKRPRRQSGKQKPGR